MYERSAIVLERYFNECFGINKRKNVTGSYQSYKDLIEDIQNYQVIVEEEETIVKSFDEVAKEIQKVQKAQEKLYQANLKLEEERLELFNELEEEPENLAKKLEMIETTIETHHQEVKDLKAEYIQLVSEFSEKQKERNECTKTRRIAEENYRMLLDNANQLLEDIDIDDVKKIKEFMKLEDVSFQHELIDIMIRNGKEEKVGFNQEVVKAAVRVRTDIAKREMECYVLAYERLKRLLLEISNDNLKLAKYKKSLRDISVKLAFLEAEKDYVVDFLDHERMTAINGVKVHEEMMKVACQNFEADITQIDNLYELILREVASHSTKKAYKELFNKTYLRDIQQTEKNFEQEINHIKINIGTIINSNYWRIEGIQTIYEVFVAEVSEKFAKDLSEYSMEEPEEEEVSILEEDFEDEIEEIEDDVVLEEKKDSEDWNHDDNDEELEEEWQVDEEQDDNWDSDYDWDEEDDEEDSDDNWNDDDWKDEDDEYDEDENEYDDEQDEDEYDDEQDDENGYHDEQEDDEYHDEDEYDEENVEDDNWNDEEDDDEWEYKYEDKSNKSVIATKEYFFEGFASENSKKSHKKEGLGFFGKFLKDKREN